MSYDLWDEMKRMQERMDSLFNNFFSSGQTLLEGPEGSGVPVRHAVADFTELDDKYVADVELPGVDKKDIKINADEEGIEIKVEKKEEKKEEGAYSRRYAGFYKYMSTPGINPDEIQAKYDNGILHLEMPKDESKQKRKQITVR